MHILPWSFVGLTGHSSKEEGKGVKVCPKWFCIWSEARELNSNCRRMGRPFISLTSSLPTDFNRKANTTLQKLVHTIGCFHPLNNRSHQSSTFHLGGRGELQHFQRTLWIRSEGRVEVRYSKIVQRPFKIASQVPQTFCLTFLLCFILLEFTRPKQKLPWVSKHPFLKKSVFLKGLRSLIAPRYYILVPL